LLIKQLPLDNKVDIIMGKEAFLEPEILICPSKVDGPFITTVCINLFF
jgi:hypothetical protein